MAARACHPKKFCFCHFFEKKQTFQKQTILLSFRKCFLNKKIFVLKTFYFRYGSTFTFVCKLKSFRFLNKINFTFVSKTLSFRKYFLSKNIFVLKKIYFRFGNTSLLFRKHFVKQIEKIASVLWSWPMGATLRWGPMFPLEKVWFADSPMSISGSSSLRSYCAYV